MYFASTRHIHLKYATKEVALLSTSFFSNKQLSYMLIKIMQKHIHSYRYHVCKYIYAIKGGHGGRVVTLSPPTSEAGVRSPHGLKWESW